MFENIRDSNYDSIIEKSSTNVDDFDDWIRSHFGYDKLVQNCTSLDDLDIDKEIGVENISDAVDRSVGGIKSRLTTIAAFYLKFDSAYNAVKHGNRIVAENIKKIEINEDNPPIEFGPDERMASFLCKTSGDRHGGNPFIFKVPSDLLQKQATTLADSTHTLYTHLYEVNTAHYKSQVNNEDQVIVNLRFYNITKTEPSNSYDLVDYRNSSSVIWLPKELIPESAPTESGGFSGEATIRLESDGEDLVIEVSANEVPTYDYPIPISGSVNSDQNSLIGAVSSWDFSIEGSLPYWQSRELSQLSENSPFDKITTRAEDSDIETTHELHEPLAIPQGEFTDQDLFVWRVERATGEEIWTPHYVTEKVDELIDEVSKKDDLTQKVAKDFLSRLRNITSDEICTEIIALLIDPDDSDSENKNYPAKEIEQIDIKPTRIAPKQDDQGKTTLVGVLAEDSEYADVQEVERLMVGLSSEPAEVVFEKLSEKSLQALNEIESVQDPESAQSQIDILRRVGPRLNWYQKDILQIAVFERPVEDLH